jgi:hypothetical protein
LLDLPLSLYAKIPKKILTGNTPQPKISASWNYFYNMNISVNSQLIAWNAKLKKILT